MNTKVAVIIPQQISAMQIHFKLDPWSLVLVRFVLLRFALLSFVLLSFALLSFALLRSALLRFALLRSALLRYALLRYALLRYALLSFTLLRFALLRFASHEGWLFTGSHQPIVWSMRKTALECCGRADMRHRQVVWEGFGE